MPEGLAKRFHRGARHQKIEGEQGEAGRGSFSFAFDKEPLELSPATLFGLAVFIGPAVLVGIVGLAGRKVGQAEALRRGWGIGRLWAGKLPAALRTARGYRGPGTGRQQDPQPHLDATFQFRKERLIVGGVFVQMLGNLGVLLHRTAIAHGNNSALPVTGKHNLLIGSDPGKVWSQISLVNPGNRGSQTPVRHLIDRTTSHPQEGRSYFRPRIALDAIKQASHASGSRSRAGVKL
jgi:hypothetical protein